MKKNTHIYIAIGLALIVAVGVWLSLSNNFGQKNIDVNENSVAQEPVKKEAVLVIDYGEKEPGSFEVNFSEKTTAFDLLKTKAEESGLNLRIKTYDIGVMIEAIGDKENGQDGKYWLYYVNAEMPDVAADKKEIKDGDKIEFKFEKSPF